MRISELKKIGFIPMPKLRETKVFKKERNVIPSKFYKK